VKQVVSTMKDSPVGRTASTRRIFPAVICAAMTVTLYIWPKYLAIASLSPFNITIMLALVVGLFGLANSRTRPRISVLAWMAILFFAMHYAVRLIADANSPTASTSIYLDVRDLAWTGSLFVVGILLRTDSAPLERISRIVCYCVIFNAALALTEVYLQLNIPGFILGHIPINVDEDYRRMLVFEKTRDGISRAQAIFQHPLVLGEVAAASIPIILARLVDKKDISALFALVCAIFTVFATGSRSSQIGAAFSICTMILFYIILKRNTILWYAAMITLPLTGIAAWYAYNEAQALAVGRTKEEQLSSSYREAMWSNSRAAISEAPFLGYGAGNDLTIAGIVGKSKTTTVDNYYLTILVNSGYLGVISLSLFLVCTLFNSLTGRLSVRRQRLHAGYLAAISTILLCQSALSITEGMAFLMFFCGLLVVDREFRNI
jgi:hypothetical protein